MTASDGNPMVLFENVFPSTPSGKVELKSEALATRWGDGALYPEWRERPTVPANRWWWFWRLSTRRSWRPWGASVARRKQRPWWWIPEKRPPGGLTAGE